MNENVKKKTYKMAFAYLAVLILEIIITLALFVSIYDFIKPDGSSYPPSFFTSAIVIDVINLLIYIGSGVCLFLLKKDILKPIIMGASSLVCFCLYLLLSLITVLGYYFGGGSVSVASLIGRFYDFFACLLAFLLLVNVILILAEFLLPKIITKIKENSSSKRGETDEEFEAKLAASTNTGKGGSIMTYTHIEVRPKDFDKKVNAMAESGWKVVSQSESAWVINKCCGLSHTVDSIINVTLAKE